MSNNFQQAVTVGTYFDFDSETAFYPSAREVLLKQFGAGMNRWKVFDHPRSFFKKGEGVSAAQPNNEPDLKA